MQRCCHSLSFPCALTTPARLRSQPEGQRKDDRCREGPLRQCSPEGVHDWRCPHRASSVRHLVRCCAASGGLVSFF